LTKKASGKRGHRNLKLIVLAFAGVAILAMGAVAAATYSALPAQQNTKIGALGSAHEHAAFMIKLDGKAIDFSQQKYQVKSPYIHVELRDGLTLHRHATGVPFSDFLHSVNMDIKGGCFISDDGKSYCNNGSQKLRYFVNESERSSIMEYVLNQGDRMMVLYGNDSSASIAQDFETLKAWHLPEQ